MGCQQSKAAAILDDKANNLRHANSDQTAISKVSSGKDEGGVAGRGEKSSKNIRGTFRNKGNTTSVNKSGSQSNYVSDTSLKLKNAQEMALSDTITSSSLKGISLSHESGLRRKSDDKNDYDGSNNSSSHLYKILVNVCRGSGGNKSNNNDGCLSATISFETLISAVTAQTASYRCPKTSATPLHWAVQLMDHEIMLPSSSQTNTSNGIVNLVDELIRAHPMSASIDDIHGHIPLHYAIAPTVYPNPRILQAKWSWKTRTTVVRLLLAADTNNQRLLANSNMISNTPSSIPGSSSSVISKSIQYLKRNDIKFTLQRLKDQQPKPSTNTAHTSDHSSKDEDDVDHNRDEVQNTNGLIDLNYENGGCSPLYRALQTLPDDFAPNSATLEFIHLLLKALVGIDTNSSSRSQSTSVNNHIRGTDVVCRGNASDGDKPLALLYRRFTRQFDLAEKFFSGDNSRTEVVEHRKNYKQAAGNTWKIIELVLQYQEQPYDVVSRQDYKTVHRAVQGETPPDLLRYIVETNAEDLTVPDESGNLPLHHAAKARPPSALLQKSKQNAHNAADNNLTAANYRASFPAFYSKYVIDELLYKYPEAAAIQDASGLYPLTLAVKSGKQWIGGGIKSLYDAYPEALDQINLEEHSALKRALSLDANFIATTAPINNNTNGDIDDYEDAEDDDKVYNELDQNGSQKNQKDNRSLKTSTSGTDLIRDELHDAIMLVQQENVDISEVVASMWAHEEDAGVQMLGCVAISRLTRAATERTMQQKESKKYENITTTANGHNIYRGVFGGVDDVMRIALSAIPAVVNAMKAHPNEVIVQEQACMALKGMAWSDGKREISFVASGAVAAIIGAMQAHVSDPGVQEQACGAVSRIIRYGGPDRATVVASVSGLTAIVNAIAAHPTCVGVQKDGCRALRELTEYPKQDANLPEITRSQTESLLETAKHNFPMECGDVVDILLSRLT